MRQWPLAIAWTALAACTLTTDLDGFTGGPAKPPPDQPDAKAAPSDAGAKTDGGDCGDVSSDPHNCGRCGKDCLGGTCTSGACGAAVLAKGFDRPIGIGLSQGKLYLGVEGGLIEVGLDGKDPRPVIRGVRPRYIWGTDTDVFFSADDDTIQRWAHTADGTTSFVIGAPAVNGVALSDTHVYYTRYQARNQGGGVYRVTFPDVGAPEKLTGWNGAECVTFADGKVYFAGDGQDTANLLHDDGSVDQLLSGGGPTGIFVLGDDAFITRQGAGELMHVSLTTKASELLAQDLAKPSGVVATANAVYWVELDNGNLDVLVR